MRRRLAFKKGQKGGHIPFIRIKSVLVLGLSRGLEKIGMCPSFILIYHSFIIIAPLRALTLEHLFCILVKWDVEFFGD